MDRRTADSAKMREVAQNLRDKALVAVLPGYAEQLIRAAEDLENYATEVERRK